MRHGHVVALVTWRGSITMCSRVSPTTMAAARYSAGPWASRDLMRMFDHGCPVQGRRLPSISVLALQTYCFGRIMPTF